MGKIIIAKRETNKPMLPIAIATAMAVGVASAVGYIWYKRKQSDETTEIEISEDDAERVENKQEECGFKPSSFTSVEQSKAYDELLKEFDGNEIKLCNFITSLYASMESADYIKVLEAYKVLK